MFKNLMPIFSLLGILFFAICLLGTLFILFLVTKEGIQKLITRHKYKHRFYKSPTAACYCRDCFRWNPENGECADPCNSRHMNEKWFCCFATPIDPEEMKKREDEEKYSKPEYGVDPRQF